MLVQPKPTTSFQDTAISFSYQSDKALARARFIFYVLDKPLLSRLLIRLTKFMLRLQLPITGIIRETIFRHFCGGDTLKQCHTIIKKLSAHHIKVIPDYSVENKKTEKGFNKTLDEVLYNLETAKGNKDIPFCVFKMTGIANMSLLEKIQNKIPLTPDESNAFEKVKKRVDTICSKAHEYQISILIDAEHSWIQEPIDDLAYEMMKKYNTQSAVVFNTFQMYRVNMLERLRSAYERAKNQHHILGVKLVRGAYVSMEQERAAKMHYQNPICTNKSSTDKSFNEGLSFCIKHIENIALVFGSHNAHSAEYLTKLMQQHNISKNDPRVWFIQLYGMGDNISFALAKEGYNVAKYLPYGPVKLVIPYLIRRAEENTSVSDQSSRELMMLEKEYKRRKNIKKIQEAPCSNNAKSINKS